MAIKQEDVNKVVQKDLEPGIIDDDLITKAVLESYRGEVGRLARMEKIVLSNISVLRLEFQSNYCYVVSPTSQLYSFQEF